MPAKHDFIDFGLMNGWTDKQWERYKKARDKHVAEFTAHPKQHQIKHTTTGIRITSRCSCGFAYSVENNESTKVLRHLLPRARNRSGAIPAN